ncbi:MAG: hypothetical protein J5I65_08755 [Aridibacter famidurans]|nr:hypothetical protein [Aridibacter famidurans]
MRGQILFRSMLTVSIVLFAAATANSQAGGKNDVPELLSPEEFEMMDNGCSTQADFVEWRFEWSKVSGAKAYHLYVKGEGAKYPVINAQGLNKTSYTRKNIAFIAPHNATGWKWKVRALVDGKWRDWSDEREFSVEPIDTDCSAS